jgi:hypothetical protein
MKKTMWNKREEPIAERLRDSYEILQVVENKTMMLNEITGDTALVSDVFEVSQDENSITDGYSMDEDRWVEYITTIDGPKEDFSVDLDDAGWIWYDELENTK